ncbi:right-handed parallel beta-helix repeat-containing protein [Paenibacillus sp. HJGM_3]|uniref:right-handed parallel beta-helix repeat-containing protein n=1 Tax=Paenibacillus sp. HJGM_3 TaxID=3379816 RepID=UPI00385E5315
MMANEDPHEGEARDRSGQTGAISRRKLLLSLGMAGAATALYNLPLLQASSGGHDSVSKAVYGPGGQGPFTLGSCCVTATIAELRANTATDPETVYFITDPGQQGWFYRDAVDPSSADNTGTILVTASGARFKRHYGEAIHARWFGAKGDGAADDTTAIQHALDAVPAAGGSVYIEDGTYRVDAVRELRPASNTTVLMSPGAVLTAIPNDKERFAVINIINKENVTIQGGTIIGERYGHLGTTGEWGMGISIRSSRNVTVRDTIVRDCWGDGIYIGTDDSQNPRIECEHVKILHVTCENNRRQGMSVTACIGGIAFASRFNKTNGTEPQSGIDLEPNSTVVVTDFAVIGCECNDNAGSGIGIYGTTDTNARQITLESNTCLRNIRGIQIRSGSHNKVLFNTCSDNKDMGIRIAINTRSILTEHNDVVGNTVNRNGGKGISIEGTATSKIRYNAFRDNVCMNNAQEGIGATYIQYARIADNRTNGNLYGIRLVGTTSQFNELSGNLCTDNEYGIQLWQASYNKIERNTCSGNKQAGLWLRKESHHNEVLSNTCIGNSQTAHNAYANMLFMENSGSNNVQMNTVRKGLGTIRAQYGIRIQTSDCTANLVTNNDMLDGGETASFLDGGTGTLTASANRL